MKAFWTLWLIVTVVTLPAHAQTAAPSLQQEAEAALIAGQPAETARLAQLILETQPDSFAPLFLLALGQSDLGDLPTAAKTGAQAYRAAASEAQRFEAARFVASTRFQAEQYTRAELWLRRAANHAQTVEERQSVAGAYQASVEANPLSLKFSAFVAPSDNINKGSEEGVLRLESIGVTFVLPEDRRSLSGVAFSASSELQYRISQSPQQETHLIGTFFSETYVLSSEAKSLLASSPNPDVRNIDGSDLAATTASVGISRQQNNISPLGPVKFGASFGTYLEGGERLVNFRDLSIEQIVPIDRINTFSLLVATREQDALSPTLLDSTAYDLVGTYNRVLANNDQLQLTFSGRHKDAGPESSFDEVQLGVGYAVAEPIWGAQLSTSARFGYRVFDEFVTTLDGREDVFVSASATATFQDFSYFGFSPSLSLSAERTESSAEENSFSTVQLLFGVQSNF